MIRPFDGLLVVCLEQAIAAPLATRHLADLGARVIKVEQPGVGDSTRHYDRVVGGMSAHFVWLNRGKESVVLDLREPSDFDVMGGILTEADVLVSNLAPGALDKLGLNTNRLTARFPRLIIVDVSGYGVGGPFDDKRAYDLLIQAEGGSCAITGFPGQPVKPGVPIADVGTAMYVYSTVLAALYSRERTGKGVVAEIAMFDVMAEFMGFAINRVIHAKDEQEPVGLGSPVVAPYGGYGTADGQVVVLGTTNDREWLRLASLMDRPEVANDPRYATNQNRIRHRQEIDDLLVEWCGSRNLDEVQSACDEARIGNARLNSVRDLLDHPQLAQRERWKMIGSSAGALPVLVPPGVAKNWEVRLGPVPSLGANSQEIWSEFGRS